MLTFISLFTGFGLFDRGLERAGWQCVYQVEINDYANRLLERDYPNVPRSRDVRDCGRHNLPDATAIVGGDPCQENSNSQRAHGAREASLGGELIRIVEECRPRLVLRENPASVRADAPWPWWRFRAELERLGYAVLPFRLRACCVGADHRRERLFLLAELPQSDDARLERHEREIVAGADEGRHHTDAGRSTGWHAESRICRGPDGSRTRKHRLIGLGNAVTVWQGETIGRMVADSLLTATGREWTGE